MPMSICMPALAFLAKQRDREAFFKKKEKDDDENPMWTKDKASRVNILALFFSEGRGHTRRQRHIWAVSAAPLGTFLSFYF